MRDGRPKRPTLMRIRSSDAGGGTFAGGAFAGSRLGTGFRLRLYLALTAEPFRLLLAQAIQLLAALSALISPTAFYQKSSS
jgi:hypothetical protein